MIRMLNSLVSACFLLLASTGALASTPVSPDGSGTTGILTDLGSFSAGVYQITGTGVVDLGGRGLFQIGPDGIPVAEVTEPGYGYFNPNGSDIADGGYGQAGPGTLLGALIGTLTATPSSPADWFLIGNSTFVTLASPGHIWASVNDTWHNNNTGSFEATVLAVPEPGSLAMLLAGLGLIGVMARRRSRG